MASLTLIPTDRNRALFEALQRAGQPIKLKTTIDGLEVRGERIEIPREMANKYLKLEDKLPEDAKIIWQSLILNRSGNLIRHDDNMIILADEEDKAEWSSIRVRRDTKDFGERWAGILNVSQAQLYDDALKYYVKQYSPAELTKLSTGKDEELVQEA